jgi:hypothetical protein
MRHIGRRMVALRCALKLGSRLPLQAARARRTRSGATRLTSRRKPTGTTACRERGSRSKARRPSSRSARALRRTRDCLHPNPQRATPRLRLPRLRAGSPGQRCRSPRHRNPLAGERWPARPCKGTNGTPTSRSDVCCTTSRGSPTGREPYGDGAPVVVRGREGRPPGEEAGTRDAECAGRDARCETPQPSSTPPRSPPKPSLSRAAAPPASKVPSPPASPRPTSGCSFPCRRPRSHPSPGRPSASPAATPSPSAPAASCAPTSSSSPALPPPC